MSEKHNIVLLAVGDIMLGDQAICMGRGVNSVIKEKGPNFIFKKIRGTLKNKDILFGNLEAILSKKNLRKPSLHSRELRGDPNSVKGLKYAGFDILSLANNHILQHGEEALSDTIRVLEENNINYVGVGNYARKPLTIEVKDKKVSFFAYCLIREPTAFNSVKTTTEILEDIRRYKDQGDIRVVSLHWGTEYMPYPSQDQIDLAHQIIDAGADIILGHHPHVLQGIEYYKKKVIAYSLGNFVFDMWENNSRQSVILKLTISDEKKIEIYPIPVCIDSFCRPVLARDREFKNFLGSDNFQSVKKADKEDYKMKAGEIHKNIGRERRYYFLKNFYRYPPHMSIQYILRAVRQRLKNHKYH
ncbi:MAG: CapA family protein [Asgard group archaeon]|nr:CapA family protein [Asgard group archaeon]